MENVQYPKKCKNTDSSKAFVKRVQNGSLVESTRDETYPLCTKTNKTSIRFRYEWCFSIVLNAIFVFSYVINYKINDDDDFVCMDMNGRVNIQSIS